MNHNVDYQHPGKLFVAEHSPVTQDFGATVTQYATFLRQQANISDEPPIDLTRIFDHFGISPKRVSLPGQSGLLLNPDRGIIFINEDHPITRQRFSEAHELMELLFVAQSYPNSWAVKGLYSESPKEKLCDKGAAELLMPRSTFERYVNERGVSLETGIELSKLYEVSLTAALIRSIQVGPGQHALILWKLAHKPSEIKSFPNPEQACLFEDYIPQPPPKKLRVKWGFSNQSGLFIPLDKSVEFDTSIYTAYSEGITVKAMDWIDLVNIRGCCYCESKPVIADGEKYVLSVIHLLNDEHSMSGRKALN